MKLSYVYWEAKEGGYVGFMCQYPDYLTQGESVKELEEMLLSLYKDIQQFDDFRSPVPEYSGLLTVPA